MGRKKFIWLAHPNHSVIERRQSRNSSTAGRNMDAGTEGEITGECCLQACSLRLAQPAFFYIPRPPADGSIDKPPTSIINEDNSLQTCLLAHLREALSHCDPLFPDDSFFCHIDDKNKKLSVLQVKEYQKSEGEETERDVMVCWRNSRKLGICFMGGLEEEQKIPLERLRNVAQL